MVRGDGLRPLAALSPCEEDYFLCQDGDSLRFTRRSLIGTNFGSSRDTLCGPIFSKLNSVCTAAIRLTYGGGNVGLQGAVASTVCTNGGIVRGFIPGYIVARKVYESTYGAKYTVSSNYYKYFKMNHVVEAFIIFPGGIDTMESLFTLISWASEGLHSKPIGLLNIDGYFNKLIKFLDDAVRPNGTWLPYTRHQGTAGSVVNVPGTFHSGGTRYPPYRETIPGYRTVG
ncbi:hypothetical protein DM860_017639 [Cuscuta australis]|uniref:cytokinin riboside 5'-monophosphate phosphoribohydrolase n=1 Tax=Cuscuta australis TaxID=267555 RepID=A0A328DUC4_9ASTE|nr:hypothetical protein DM860_017639 [Cuscuta australis]